MIKKSVVHGLIETECSAEILCQISEIIPLMDTYSTRFCRGHIDINIQ